MPLPGHLYVVATPIGNLGDLTDRARALLGGVDAIACEDTRTTGLLLARLGIQRPLLPYHEHNEREAADGLAARLRSGASVALVTDAGTPGLSDPGFRVVRLCRRQGLPVIPVPGPNAAVAALSASGLPTNGYLFAGFLPPKSSARRAFFERQRDFEYTIVLYESCHRIAAAVGEAREILGDDRVIAVVKEMTKLHETWLVGTAAHVAASLAKIAIKGEFVLLLAPGSFEL